MLLRDNCILHDCVLPYSERCCEGVWTWQQQEYRQRKCCERRLPEPELDSILNGGHSSGRYNLRIFSLHSNSTILYDFIMYLPVFIYEFQTIFDVYRAIEFDLV